MTRNAVVLQIFALLLLGGGAASAQTNALINAGLQFNFSTPGARSLGLGGAFLGLADDATAAFTNPAGLTILNRPEISLEGRSWSYTHVVPYRGHAFGNPTGTGVDDLAGVQTREFENDVSGLSFVSFVYPGNRWALAFYRHQLANFEADVETAGVFRGPPDDLFRFFPIRGSLDLEIVNYGLSGAFRITDDLSLGLGAAYYDFQIDSLTDRFDAVGAEPTGPGGFFGPPDFSPDNVVNSQEITGDAEDVAAIVGLLWEIHPAWSLGAVYRQGPSFDFSTRNVGGPSRGQEFAGQVFAENQAVFNVPDVYGAGLAYRPTDSLTLTFDYDRIEYSALTEEITPLFLAPEDITPERRAALDRLEIDDADEFHLGIEYVFLGTRIPWAVRAGAYHDPDHRMAFQGAPTTEDDRRLATIFREGDDEVHYSVGLGAVFGAVQVDAAADFSDLIETFSLSGVYRF